MSFTADTRVDEATAPSSSLFDSLSSAFTSLFPTAHADEGEGDEEGGDDKGEDGEQEGGEEEGGEEEEEEEDEPEDPQPAIYEECENSKECSPAKHHFLECQERVEAGNGFKDENCVEEFPSRPLREYLHSTKAFQQAQVATSPRTKALHIGRSDAPCR